MIAAVLACGDGAVLSHRSAAHVWGLRASSPAAIDVTAIGRTRHRRPEIVVHRPRRFDVEDRAELRGIPVTTVARTLLDLAEMVRQRELARAIEQAELLNVFDLQATDELIGRSRGRRGLRALRSELARFRETTSSQFTRSELERALLELCHREGLPTPSMNIFIEGLEVDAVWPDARLAVEMDGFGFHRTAAAFERDRRRDETLQLAGYRVLRFTYRRLKSDPAGIAQTLRDILNFRQA
jgi:very-short-patch-repair endonuclease